MMTRTTIKQTLIDHGVTEVSGALLDWLSAMPQAGDKLACPLTDEQVKYLAYRFCNWPLPADFHPDNGISVSNPYANNPEGHRPHWQPVGTNLLTFDQAEAMVRHMIEGMPTALTASGNDVLRELLRDMLALNDDAGATSVRMELSSGWHERRRAISHRIYTTLSTTPTMSAEDMREAAASRLCPECEGEGVAEMIGGWPRPCDACHGTGSLPLTKEPTQ